jgi:CheY-like chemotaxis protein
MTRILVAEDSATQIVYIRGLLEEANYDVDIVRDGREAVQRLESGEQYDLVLTDVMMPGMDGMQLARAVRVHYAGIPVILMTGQGTDALAVEALEEGAAGYVPKSQLTDKLIYEIEQVLHTSTVNRSYETLLSCLTLNQFTFEMPNDSALIYPLVDLLQQLMMGMGLCDSAGRLRAGIALEHALLNAMYRGNLEISPSEMLSAREHLLQEVHDDLVLRRRAAPAYRDRRVHVEVHMSPAEARFVIRDQGNGFDVSRVPRPGDPDALERDSAHGLLLMQTFMDEVKFNEAGNEVTMIKRRPRD